MVPVPVSFGCFYNLSVDKRLSDWEWPEVDHGTCCTKKDHCAAVDSV